MLRCASALLSLLLLSCLPAAAATSPLDNPAAHAGEVAGTPDTSPYLNRWTGYRPMDYAVGDSVTVLGLPWLRRRGIGWEVSAIPGRDVSTLPFYLAERMRHDKPPRGVVIALGANASPGWTKTRLRAAINQLPPTTIVTLVTPYRDKRWKDADYRRASGIAWYYAGWMRDIAKERPHTCLADWAREAAALEAKTPGRVLYDGVHTTEYGRQVWSWRVSATARNCR